MGALKDFFNRIFNRNKTLMLEEGNGEYSQTTPDIKRQDWIIKQNENYHHAFTKQDRDILEFLKGYYNEAKARKEIKPEDYSRIAYSALIRMRGKPATRQELQKNEHDEKQLLEKLEKTSKYNVKIQGAGENPSFFRVRSANYKMPEAKNMRRIYINCNNGNIASLADKLLTNNNNPNFYLKFCANEYSKRRSRGEKVVIYCDKSELNHTLRLVEYTREKNPELFKESENTLPFLKKYKEIASFAKEPESKSFIDLKGQRKPCINSANSVLANFLMESYNETFKELARADYRLKPLLSGPYNEGIPLKYLPFVYNNYKGYLVDSINAKLQALAIRNDFELEGTPVQNRYKAMNKQTERTM